MSGHDFLLYRAAAESRACRNDAFATLTLARLFHGFNCRSQKSMARAGLRSNKYSMGAFLGGCILLGLVLCVPVFERLFDVAEMGVLMYGYILLLALCRHW